MDTESITFNLSSVFFGKLVLPIPCLEIKSIRGKSLDFDLMQKLKVVIGKDILRTKKIQKKVHGSNCFPGVVVEQRICD